jgi:hypothetical protein
MIFTLLVLITSAQAQEQCQLAYPMMEVLKCEKSDAFDKKESFKCPDSNCQITYSCVSDCTFSVHIDCGMLSEIRGEVRVDGELVADLSKFISGSGKADVSGLTAGDGASIVITASCARLFIPYHLDTTKSYANFHDYNKFLFATNHEWSSHKLYDTSNCIPQSRVANFINKQIKSGNLPNIYLTGGTDILGNFIVSYENFVDISKLNLASEMKVGDTISYFYRWEPVSNINLKYDENKNPVYCGGSSDQRKLIGYNTITTNDGSCYYVPSYVIKQVECCLDGDCSFTGQLCGPGFVCTDKKPCNGMYDCGTEEPQCTGNLKSWWGCDVSQGPVNMPDGQTYKGWCKKETKQVKCCPNSCQTGYHCVEDIGCEPDIRLIECPSGKCCKSGGNYRPKTCDSGLICCPTGDPLIGECKVSCQPTTTIQGEAQPTGTEGSPFTGLFGLGSNLLIGIVVAIIAVVGIVIYFLKKKEGFESGEKKEKDLLGGDI